MKYKALRTKTDPKEFVEIMNLGGTNMLFTSASPNLLPITCTMEGLKEYHETQSPLPKEINLDDFELIELEIFEANTVGADIRNKLSPIKNLLAILDVIDFSDTDNIKYLRENINLAKISLKDLSNLL